MPVHKGNIPYQEDLRRWPHLENVYLPQIDSEFELLTETNVRKALEPLQVICSVDGGPYVIKTILGWIVNGPLGGDSGNGLDVVSVNLSPELGGTLAAAIENQFPRMQL